MNSSSLLFNLARFVLLLLVQVVVFNNINFLGFINPYPYILFIILFPVNGNKYGLLGASFLLGILMDLFCNSGGVHTAACLMLAYIRPSIFKFSFGLSYEYQTVKLNDVLTPERFSFLLIAVAVHHLTLFLIEVFTLEFFWSILVRTLVSTLFTVLLCILIIYLIKPSKR
ncbi:rod shape-determining protein MreD [Flavobacterium sp.]|jgi:rod shape-determining protein MreD|uniref:rod shape-determining protein MreD n=1 Tax=Flavobacterium sp. TaxID=239 RepID=UPI0022C72DC9|nr:rod shape-determining protein MreD [Flavobacterium sp.]MCZ8143883.1 rod shape-determining protein MreD [Flavobacterium sp.]MCZ8367530.1 rod shape-determining protein MreD [Flavobacterium sp.]